MRLDIRTKLVLVSLGLIAASIFVLEAYLRPLIEQEILDGLRADLFGRLALIEGTSPWRSKRPPCSIGMPWPMTSGHGRDCASP